MPEPKAAHTVSLRAFDRVPMRSTGEARIPASFPSKPISTIQCTNYRVSFDRISNTNPTRITLTHALIEVDLVKNINVNSSSLFANMILYFPRQARGFKVLAGMRPPSLRHYFWRLPRC